MDYEKKYTEALERGERIIKSCIENDASNDVLVACVRQIFPELKESEDERIRKEIKQHFLYLDDSFPDKAKWLAWLEKQSEQKPADKVESKFKVGDWIIQENIGVYKVIEICKSWYEVINTEDNHYSISFDKEYMCHLWSIEDAKYGDMLVSVSNQPFIYNGKFTERTVGAYCGLNVYGEFLVNKYPEKIKCSWTDNKDIKPATKEQRDFLLREMHRADYEWDAEKKELKKMNSIFPFQAKIKQTGKIITIIAGQLDMAGKKYIQYQSDKNDGYSVYNPNDFEKLNC